MEDVLAKMSEYYPLTDACKEELRELFRQDQASKNDYILRIGEVPKYYYFLQKGLLSYNYIAENGDTVIKKFFAENSFVASTAALIQQIPGLFSIQALEDCEYIRFSASKFRELFEKYPDLAMFQIRYIEKNWIVDKENLEISLKYETAKERYIDFLKEYAHLKNRIKQHHISSFLGITPTQLSRIKKELIC